MFVNTTEFKSVGRLGERIGFADAIRQETVDALLGIENEKIEMAIGDGPGAFAEALRNDAKGVAADVASGVVGLVFFSMFTAVAIGAGMIAIGHISAPPEASAATSLIIRILSAVMFLVTAYGAIASLYAITFECLGRRLLFGYGRNLEPEVRGAAGRLVGVGGNSLYMAYGNKQPRRIFFDALGDVDLVKRDDGLVDIRIIDRLGWNTAILQGVRPDDADAFRATVIPWVKP